MNIKEFFGVVGYRPSYSPPARSNAVAVVEQPHVAVLERMPEPGNAQAVVSALCRQIDSLTQRVQELDGKPSALPPRIGQPTPAAKARECPLTTHRSSCGDMCPLVDPRTGYYMGNPSDQIF
jgi:hypothetical protein